MLGALFCAIHNYPCSLLANLSSIAGHDAYFVAGLIGMLSLELRGGFDYLPGTYYSEFTMRLRLKPYSVYQIHTMTGMEIVCPRWTWDCVM